MVDDATFCDLGPRIGDWEEEVWCDWRVEIKDL